MLTPFHLAINVTDLATTRVFYGEVLGAKEGRSTRRRRCWELWRTN